MDLILWRHAEAVDGTPDSARPLTIKGLGQADQIARWLRERLPEGCTLLVSPAVRTQQTAAALKMEFATSVNVGLRALPSDILAAAHWPDSAQPILVVGHQPTLGQLAARLLNGSEFGCDVQIGAVWWFSSGYRGGDRKAVLRAVISPDFL